MQLLKYLISKLDFINHFIMSKPLGKKRDRYRKMPLKTKILFLKRVLEEGHSIKKVSAEYKINYSTAKTLIRNQKLKKGKIKLSELNLDNCMMDRDPTSMVEISGMICSYKIIENRVKDENQNENLHLYPKIEIISRISFPFQMSQ